ncbi:MAG: BrxA/BrxB family bacilliredoxin [Thermoanaerobaculia bacterium]
MLNMLEPAAMLQSMRDELVRAGFRELRSPQDVDSVLGPASGKVLVFVNSVCGCAAGSARPGIAAAVQGADPSLTLATVFAGQDRDATERARGYFSNYPPSSPSIAILKDGVPVYHLARRQIEGRGPDFVAAEVRAAISRI